MTSLKLTRARFGWLLVALVLWSAPIQAATCFAAINGGNSQHGTSLSTPFPIFGTIQRPALGA